MLWQGGGFLFNQQKAVTNSHNFLYCMFLYFKTTVYIPILFLKRLDVYSRVIKEKVNFCCFKVQYLTL
jgi:hypothetical protein